MPITLRIVSRPEDVAAEAAENLVELIRRKPNAVLGLATGGTVIPLYRELVRRYQARQVDFSHVTTFNLDEYVGLAPTHDQSYRAFMDAQLFSRINIPLTSTHVLHGTALDLAAECAAYEQAIMAAGGIDLQILGIGKNGHIAFNEPGSPKESRTRIVDLSAVTLSANSDGRFFKDPTEVPRQALTMGIATILEARKILLLATGSGKAVAVAAALNGAMDPRLPASLLQTHTACTFITDRDAASNLPFHDGA